MDLISPDPFEYEIVETDDPVTGDIEFSSYISWRAVRWCEKANRNRRVPFYRYEVFEDESKYVVVAMQNKLVRKRDDGTSAASEDRPDKAS